MKRKQLLNLSALAVFFLTTAIANAQITFTGPYTSKTGNLAQDVMNSLYEEFVNSGSSTAQTLALDYSADTSGTSFVTEFSDLWDTLDTTSDAAVRQTTIEGFVNDSSKFDQAGAWIGTTAPNNPLTPVVSNVTASQVAGTKHMEIFFDLAVADNNPCTVTVLWSTDNGASYPLTATSVTGKAGPGVAPGVGHKITWDMEVDWDNKFTQTGRIKVIASRDPIDRE
jgi:hypothetical protein